MKAVIMAGGKGTRLLSVTGHNIPKAMVNVCSKPILQYQLEILVKYNITEIIILVGYLHEKIEEFFGDGSKFGVKIKYLVEEKPLGTGGALVLLKKIINHDFILIFGDIIFDIDVQRMINFHKERDADVTLLVHPNSHPYDSDLVEIDEINKVTGFDSKNNVRDYDYKNLVNAGIYILSERFFSWLPQEVNKMDLEKDLLIKYYNEMNIYAYITPEYIRDVGTPERLYQTERDLSEGIVSAKNLTNKQKCIFLDRDGTINRYVGLLTDKDKFELETGVAEAIKRINQSNYLCIVITNQPVIARNLCSLEMLHTIHNRMETLLGHEGAYLDSIFYCPHHPDKGYPEENKAYKIECSCRKPKIGLLSKCEVCYNINLDESWFIGDTTTDIQTAKNAGCRSVLLGTGIAGNDRKYNVIPDYTFNNLKDAVNSIIENK